MATHSASEQSPLRSDTVSYTKGTIAGSSGSSSTSQSDDSNNKSNSSITIYHIIILQIGSLFNYLQSKSYKIFSGYIHYDLGISYKTLTYTVFVSGYISIFNLFVSKHYNRIPCNIFIFTIFASASLSAWLLYYFYEYTFIIFLSRPLLTLSTFTMWNYVLCMLANFVDDDKKRNVLMISWNTTYPLSTLALVITGVIIDHLSYFDYLLLSAFIAICIGVICLFVLPKASIYSLSTENRDRIDKQLKQSILSNMFNICSNNELFICMMCCAAMDSMLLSSMNVFIGPYLKDIYSLNAQQLGIYATTSIGSAEVVTSIVIIPWIATQNRFHKCILIGAFIECVSIVIWNILHLSKGSPFALILVVISFVYVGHELLFCGIMFKNHQVAHKAQQVILVAIWTVIITVFGSMGNIMVGELYGTEDGVFILLVLFLVLSTGTLFAGCALCYFVHKKKIQKEYQQLDKVHVSDQITGLSDS